MTGQGTHEKKQLIDILRRAHEQYLAEVRGRPGWDARVRELEELCRKYRALPSTRFPANAPAAAGALLTVEVEGLHVSRATFFVAYENRLALDRKLWTDFAFPNDVQLVEERRVRGLRAGDRWTEPAPSRADFDEYRYTILAIG